jgi:hypothetical protein
VCPTVFSVHNHPGSHATISLNPGIQCYTFFLNKRWPSDGPGARHAHIPTAATRTLHFAALNTGFFSLTSLRQCVSEVNVWLFLWNLLSTYEFRHGPRDRDREQGAAWWRGPVEQFFV